MEAAVDPQPRHLVSRTVAQLQAQVESLTDASLWSMSPGETADTLTALTRLVASVSELELRVADHANRTEVGESSGATSTANWWAHATQQTRPEAHRKMRLAAGLERYPLVREALSAGGLVVEQATVIVKVLDDLPTDIEALVRGEAERRLVALGREHDAKDLKRLGLRILEVLDPEAADEHERRKLAAEERNANATVRFTMAEDGQGRVHGRFTLPALHGAMLKKALHALAAPKHLAATDGAVGERLPGPERLGRAFCEYLERYPADKLPASGGVNATVVVTMNLDSLLGGLQAASLDTGERIPPTGPAGWRVRPGSSPPCSAESPRSSTWAGSVGSTTRPNGSRWPWNRVAAPPRGATGRPGCATPTTTRLPGAREVAPASATAGSSARGTTPGPTTPPSRWRICRAGRSPSPDARESVPRRRSLGAWQRGSERNVRRGW